ncbi:Rpb7-binding protein seb1 [Neolecta irregularis DAH-3]|uniref:Rpb7-binding protein seb1 n=1 Tax=Neolecta irregularis (strain DAH-3) TaxID=1198029 RepID=A0A1U7LSF7_NEOID|nr:Rpb7-binding protein seb1 [Neolecta irregularis DAH-3]|eukprot:OLL25451.1 Rpb7-binding protein seb1 [Neolecta irregularis DAH-3]
MSAIDEFEKLLQALSASKNGISASKISSINALAISNVQVCIPLQGYGYYSYRDLETIGKHFKKTPGPLKLGVLYVVDSISRAYYDQARKTGQPLDSTDEGTFSGGLSRITAVIESLMNDVILHAPEDHKIMRASFEKQNISKTTYISIAPGPNIPRPLISPGIFADGKLLDIWEKAGTFPQDIMNSIRTKHFSSAPLDSPVRTKQGSSVELYTEARFDQVV